MATSKQRTKGLTGVCRPLQTKVEVCERQWCSAVCGCSTPFSSSASPLWSSTLTQNECQEPPTDPRRKSIWQPLKFLWTWATNSCRTPSEGHPLVFVMRTSPSGYSFVHFDRGKQKKSFHNRVGSNAVIVVMGIQ